MSDHLHYVPILKAKQGELNALSHIAIEDRDRLTPLLEASEPDGDPTETLGRLAEKVVAAWGRLDECFVDLARYGEGPLEDGSHPVARFFETARKLDLIAVPVTGLDRGSSQCLAVRAVASVHPRRAAIRLRIDDVEPLSTLGNRLRDLRAALDLEAEQVDLLIDLGAVLAGTHDELAARARALLHRLPMANGWRSLTLASGAFPQTSTAFAKPGDSGSQPRRDWLLWKSIVDNPGGIDRLPAFGDYGADNVAWVKFDPKTMHPTAGIRYTTADSWLMVRGRSLASEAGYGQFHAVSKRMAGRPEYRGARHCWGDKRIRRCARGEGGTGSLGTWREVATAHHLRVVDDQLASLAESAAAR